MINIKELLLWLFLFSLIIAFCVVVFTFVQASTVARAQSYVASVTLQH